MWRLRRGRGRGRESAPGELATARLWPLLRAHGRTTTAFQTLEPGLDYWFGRDACVAYADTGGAWVAASPPLAPRSRQREVMHEFAVAAAARGRRVSFFGPEEDFAGDPAFAALHVGDEPVWNPASWPAALAGKRSLREQLRRARAKGVTVRPLPAAAVAEPGSPQRLALQRLERRWLRDRGLAPMSFVARVELFGWPDERRYWLAERAGVAVAAMVAVPIPARGGWLIEDTPRDHHAPNGTVELLFDHAMRHFAAQGVEHVTWGLAPLAEVGNPWLQRIRDHTRWIYDFEGLRAFKAKLRPDRWQPIHLAHPREVRGARAVLDALTAFAGGSLWRFGLRTLRHRTPEVVRIMAWLLLPWALAMALADSSTWFPGRAVHIAWLLADGVLFVALMVLVYHWRRPLARALAVLVGVDFALGLLQALTFNLPRATSPEVVAVCAAAVLAPALVCALLLAAGDDVRPIRRHGPLPAVTEQ